MRRFRISDTLRPNIERILHRRAVRYQMDDNHCTVDMSGEQFHKIVLRAKMEKLQEETGSPVPYVARTELNDRTVIQEVGNAYCIQE